MLIDLIGNVYRMLPPLRGKGFLAQMMIAPFIRGKNYEVIVNMNNPGGGKIICNLDDLIPWNIYLYGRYQIEKNYEAFLLKTVVGSKVILDIGANIGYYTIQFGRILGKQGVVHSFEPCSYQFDTLERNIKLNDLANVIKNKLIVSDQHDVRKKIFFSGMTNTGSSSLEIETKNFEEVECTTLDRYCEQKNIEKIDVVKIDVEGHEMGVLKGMERLLRDGKVINLFLEINTHTLSSAGTSAFEIISYLQRFLYKPYSIASGQTAEYSMGEDESLVFFRRDV